MNRKTELVLAGGCFWGMQELFRQLPGVLETQVGYCGGHIINPTYMDIKQGNSGHAESIKIFYDPSVISFENLLHFFFQIHDPTTPNQQGNDYGTQYRSVIFYCNDQQKLCAEQIIAHCNASGLWPGQIVTHLVPTSKFYMAEPEHQNYLQRYPDGYTCHWLRSNWRINH